MKVMATSIEQKILTELDLSGGENSVDLDLSKLQEWVTRQIGDVSNAYVE